MFDWDVWIRPILRLFVIVVMEKLEYLSTLNGSIDHWNKNVRMYTTSIYLNRNINRIDKNGRNKQYLRPSPTQKSKMVKKMAAILLNFSHNVILPLHIKF